MREREVTPDNLRELKAWVESEPHAPDGDWYKDFGSFKLCGPGEYPRTILKKGMKAYGEKIE